MDVDEDDDFYDDKPASPEQPKAAPPPPEAQAQPAHDDDDDLEEGEEEDGLVEDGSDSDIDIITERKDGSKAAPPSQPKYNEIRNIPQRTSASEVSTKLPAVKKESQTKSASAAHLPGMSTSKIDVDAKPMYEPAGKRITQVNIDEDLNENEKPWRRPGTDISDYFNYGFDEFTWALYASKQESLRSEFNQDKIAQNNKKMFEDMNMMMAMGGMPGMPGMPAAGAGAMPGMEGMPPEMQQMMQQMMASGMDPSQMDPAAMFAGMQGATGAGAGAAQGANQGQAFAGQGFNQGQGQMGGYGFDQGMNQNGGRGGFGRGRGRGRNW